MSTMPMASAAMMRTQTTKPYEFELPCFHGVKLCIAPSAPVRDLAFGAHCLVDMSEDLVNEIAHGLDSSENCAHAIRILQVLAKAATAAVSNLAEEKIDTLEEDPA